MVQFRGVLIGLWLLGAVAAYIFAQQQHIPPGVAVPVAIAFLVELTLFLGMGRLNPPNPAILAVSALVPYLLYTVPTATFQPVHFLRLAALVATGAFWLRITRNRYGAQWLFLLFIGAVVLAKIFKILYPPPFPDLRVDALGQLMWFRLAITAWLLDGPRTPAGFGFLPSYKEWKTGLLAFALFLPVGVLLVWATRFATFQLSPGFWWKGPGTFLGIFLVVALFEEFFFRGVVLEALRKPWGDAAALFVSSLLFGLVHLWFRDFPNTKFALLATSAGLFYGGAYLAAGSIRAAMVAHALVVALWRVVLA